MTDRTPPTSDGTVDRDESVDARWFREIVSPVVDAKPVITDWNDLRDRTAGKATTVVSLTPTTPGRSTSPRRRLALVAAAVLALTAIGGAVLLNRNNEGDGENVVATPPERELEPTGWYVPDEVPVGWELESVTTDWIDVEEIREGIQHDLCPCDSITWANGDDALALSKVATAGERDPDDIWVGDNMVDLGDGVKGSLFEPGGKITILRWEFDAHTWMLTAAGPDQAQLVEAAKALIKDPSASEPPLDGYHEVTSGTIPPDIRAYRSVLVTFVNTTSGRKASYGLVPEGFNTGSTFYLAPVPSSAASFEGQDLPLTRFYLDERDQSGELVMLGRWPGAEIFIGRFVEPTAAEPMTAADLGWLAAALRPATSVEWSAFLDTATGTVDEKARADRLSDLVVRDGSSPDGTVESAHDEKTSTTFAADQADPVGSGPRQTRVDTLANGVQVELSWSASVPQGQMLRVDAVWSNPTASRQYIHRCAWQVVAADHSMDPEVAGQNNCEDGPDAIDAGGTSRSQFGFHAEVKPPGRYDAVVGGFVGGGNGVRMSFWVPFVVLPSDPGIDPSRSPEDRFVDFALYVEGRQPVDVPADLFAPTVDLGLGWEPLLQVDRAALANFDRWTIGRELATEYAGLSGPFSALDNLNRRRPTASGGPLPLCAGSTDPTEPDVPEGHRMVLLAPPVVDSCLNWYGVVLVIDPDERISAVHLYLWEP